MKKTVRNLFAAFAAAALIGSLASCAASDEENPFVAASTNGSESEKSSGGNSGAGDENEQILMDSPVDLDWNMSNTASVAKEKVTGASDSSKIKIYYTANEDTDYTAFKLMGGKGAENELYAGIPEGFTIDTTAPKADDLHGCKFTIAPADAVASISYAPSAVEWAKIKANGFAIIGHGAKITKISLTGSSSLPSEDDSNSSLVEDNTEGENESVVKTIELVQNFYDGENHGLSLRKTISEMGIDITPAAAETYTIHMKGTATDYTHLKNVCIGFETDYDWTNCAMEGGKDLSNLQSGVDIDVTFSGIGEGDWFFWFYDGDTDVNAEKVTISLTEFSVTKK